MPSVSPWQVVKRAGSDFIEDDAMTLAAALAFYSALSLAPLLLIMLWITSFFGEGTQQAVVGQLEATVGPQAAQGIEMVLQNTSEQPSAGTISGIIGIVVLLFSATGVFAQLQAAMNRIWDVKPAPGQGVWGFIRKRILSAGMIFAILFLLLVSLAVSTMLSAIVGGGGQGIVWQAVNIIVSLAVFVLLFGLIFKYLPDVKVGWKSVLIGAALTAALFVIGKWAIGLYLSRGAVGSSYGAAGALLVLLVWVYYSSLILFFGAELTQAYARQSGAAITADERAVWADEDERAAATGARAARREVDAASGRRGPDWGAVEPSHPQSQPRRGARQ